MLYFAYGSNMDCGQMRKRCPSARFMGIALLPDHKLAFTRKSETRGCGVADAVPDADRRVWGVVYEIDDIDVDKLDKCEGYRAGRETNSYWRRERLILLDGDVQQPLTVSAYFASPQQDPPLPDAVYKSLIVDGAKFWQLPNDYIRELEHIEVSG